MKPHIVTGPRRRHCRCRVCRGRQVKANHRSEFCFENPNYGEQEERRLMAYGVMA